jgi:hypothetical protein
VTIPVQVRRRTRAVCEPHLVLQHRGVLTEPIPLPGRLGLWDLPPDVTDRIKRELCL